MGWAAAAPVIGSVAGGLLGRSGAKEQARAAREANKPKPFSSTTTSSPYGPIKDPLNQMIQESMNLYGRQQRNFRGGGGRPPGYQGVNVGSFNLGPSDLSRELVGEMAERARGGSANLDAAGSYVQGRLGGGSGGGGNGAYSNPFLSTTFDRASGGSPTDSLYQDFIDRLRSPRSDGDGGGLAPSSTVRITRRSGGPSIAGSPTGGKGTDYSNPLLEDYLKKEISGEFLDEGNPYLGDIADRITQQSGEAEEQAVADLMRREMGAGRFGRGRYGTERERVSEGFADALGGNLANLYGSAYESDRNRQGAAAGLSSGRDVSRWGDLTDRYGIDTGRSIANANNQTASSIARSNSADTLQGIRDTLAAQERMHGLDTELGALGAFTGSDLSRLGVMSNLSGMYGEQDLGYRGLNTNADLAALGAVPGLEEAGWLGYNNAYGASSELDERRRAAEQARLQGAMHNAAGRNRAASDRWRYENTASGNMLDDNIRRLLTIGGGYGTTSTRGTAAPNTNIPVPSTSSGLLSGLIGGGMAGLGVAGQLRNRGGGGNPFAGNLGGMPNIMPF